MKKKFLMLIILVAFACPSFGAKEKQKFEQPEEWLNISNEANVLYAQNEIQQAQNLFLSIPDDQRSAQNWLLIGNILQDQGKLSEGHQKKFLDAVLHNS